MSTYAQAHAHARERAHTNTGVEQRRSDPGAGTRVLVRELASAAASSLPGQPRVVPVRTWDPRPLQLERSDLP